MAIPPDPKKLLTVPEFPELPPLLREAVEETGAAGANQIDLAATVAGVG